MLRHTYIACLVKYCVLGSLDARNVACMWENKNAYRDLEGQTKEQDHLECIGVQGVVILKWILYKIEGCALNHTTQVRDKWRGTTVSTEKKNRIASNASSSFTG